MKSTVNCEYYYDTLRPLDDPLVTAHRSWHKPYLTVNHLPSIKIIIESPIEILCLIQKLIIPFLLYHTTGYPGLTGPSLETRQPIHRNLSVNWRP